MMKKLSVITGCVMMVAVMISCKKVKRTPDRAYMPDMSYSRAYETYASTQALQEEGVNYLSKPVPGTIARGDMAAYMLANDSTGYVQSAAVKSPINKDSVNMTEAERLYLVNCGICHGTKLDGNGPLYKGGDGPFPNKPATLAGDAKYEAMTEGTMFHSVTYGKNSMGSYASQLSTKQRWQVIAYIKSKQGGARKDSAMAAAPKTDTMTKKGK